MGDDFHLLIHEENNPKRCQSVMELGALYLKFARTKGCACLVGFIVLPITYDMVNLANLSISQRV